MHGVVFPEKPVVKHAMAPVQYEIRRYQIENTLLPKRQSTDRAMAMVVELSDGAPIGDAEQQHRPNNRDPDSHIAGKYRHEDPVGEIRSQTALLPPGFTRVAR